MGEGFVEELSDVFGVRGRRRESYENYRDVKKKTSLVVDDVNKGWTRRKEGDFPIDGLDPPQKFPRYWNKTDVLNLSM